MTSSLQNPFKALKGRKVLVTGAAGFIGSTLVRALAREGVRVTAVVRPQSDLWRLEDVLPQIELIHFELGGGTVEDLRSHISDIQMIFHLGAAGTNLNTSDFDAIVKGNIVGTRQILELGRMFKVERFVYCGSCSEYGQGQNISEKAPLSPLTDYDVSKSAGWMMAQSYQRKHGLPVVCLRPFTVYGPYEANYRLIPHTITKALEGGIIPLTGGEQTRDFVYVNDAVSAFAQAAVADNVAGEVFNLAGGRDIAVKDAVSLIIELAGTGAKPLFGAQPYRAAEIWKSSGNPSWAAERLGWTAQTDLTTGLKETIAWFKSHRSSFAHYQTVSQ